MKNKYSVESRFVFRLKVTKNIFGYISLEAIVNSQLKHKSYNTLKLKRINFIKSVKKKVNPIPETFKINHINK